MHRPFPYHSAFGHLLFINVRDYYDFPLLYTCVNERRQFFVGLWVDTYRHGDIWLLVRISPQRLEHLTCQGIELRELFLEPEFGTVLKVVEDYGPDHPKYSVTVEYWTPEQIPDDYLSVPGEYW